MKRILKSPVVNAVCISLFTTFYAFVFYITTKSIDFKNSLQPQDTTTFWSAWSSFLAAGHQIYIAIALIVMTMLVVVLLIIRRRPYDEYHTTILMHCLVVAAILTLIAIAIFYLLILNNPVGVIEKFTLFIVIHWTTVIFANLNYILLCRWR